MGGQKALEGVQGAVGVVAGPGMLVLLGVSLVATPVYHSHTTVPSPAPVWRFGPGPAMR